MSFGGKLFERFVQRLLDKVIEQHVNSLRAVCPACREKQRLDPRQFLLYLDPRPFVPCAYCKQLVSSRDVVWLR